MKQNQSNSWKDLLGSVPNSIQTRFMSKFFQNCNSEKIDSLDKVNQYFEKKLNLQLDKPYIYVGAGTCGLAAGADTTMNAINKYLKEKSIDAKVIETGCIGLCSSEPLVDVQLPGKNRISFQNVTEERVSELLDGVFNNHIKTEDVIAQFRSDNEAWQDVPYLDEHIFFKLQKRNVLKNCGLIDPESIEEYCAHGGYQAFIKTIHTKTPVEVCELVEKSGLRGRGGGGFPTGKKWKMTHQFKAPKKFMICNADEGDPGAFMDRAVIEGDPHRLLEGLAIGAYAINANKAYIYIRAEYPLAIKRLKIAIDEAKKYGFLGNNIFDSGFNLEIIVKEGAGAFVCGEETALMHSIEGKRGMPRPRPPYPAESGLFEQPSIINNVETFANVAEILNHGADWFNSIGTENSNGTKVFALSGKVNRTGLIEVPNGISLRQIIFDIGGGILNDKKFKAVQIGGPSGGCIPEQYLDIEIDYESLKKVGAMMGSGGLVVMDEDNCMVDVAKFFMDFIQRESCGKCIPCREGTKRILEILNMITTSRKSETGYDALERFQGIVQIENIAQTIKETSLCGLGQTAANPVLSTLKMFRDEYEQHIYDRKCPTKTCVELLTYSINEEKCTGCTACTKKCPTNAIMGQKKVPHYIITDKCISCGSCLDTCRFDAIVVS